MNPASEIELRGMKEEFEKLLTQGNGQLKAAYLAASGRGYVNLLELNRDNVKLFRESDDTFIICSYPLTDCSFQEEVSRPMRIVSFHTNETILKKD